MNSAASPGLSWSVTGEHDVPARMRDGVVLRADVYRPPATGRGRRC
jgi:predicted acyl esterase